MVNANEAGGHRPFYRFDPGPRREALDSPVEFLRIQVCGRTSAEEARSATTDKMNNLLVSVPFKLRAKYPESPESPDDYSRAARHGYGQYGRPRVLALVTLKA